MKTNHWAVPFQDLAIANMLQQVENFTPNETLNLSSPTTDPVQ